MTDAKDILRKIKLGASVAEFDSDLERYFIETETFRSVINDEGDIVSGDKGTGKTAIYKILKSSYRSYEKLDSVEIVDAFNPQGDPVFQRLLSGPNLNEDQYRTFWKAYIFSLVGNWLLDIYPRDYNEKLSLLYDTLSHLGLDATDVSPETIFGKLHRLVDTMVNPSAVETEFSLTESGMPVLKPRVEFGSTRDKGDIIYNGDYLSVLDEALNSIDTQIWVLFDRLDEAFAGSPAIEVPTLRALLRSYLDLSNFSCIRPKLFLRKDLFRRLIKGGFVNLTHVNARRIEIVWDDEDLWSMIMRRIIQEPEAEISSFFGENPDRRKVFSVLFPEQIDVGDRKTYHGALDYESNSGWKQQSATSKYDRSTQQARDAQIRREQREPREIQPEVGPIIESDSVKRAFRQLSEQRVQDTLLAEADELIPIIEQFRDGKSEHNPETLRQTIGDVENYGAVVQSLVDVGFLEEFGANYKIPMLYRDGLRIRQGKAFTIGDDDSDEEE